MKITNLLNELRPRACTRFRAFPVLGPVVDDLLLWFQNQGYTRSTIRNHVQSFDELVRWLKRCCGDRLASLSQQHLEAAYQYFRKRKPGVAGSIRATARFLRDRRHIPQGRTSPPPLLERQLNAFGSYLLEVRGLAEATVAGHKNRLRSFLKFVRFDQQPSAIRTLHRERIEAFVGQAAKTNNRFSLQHVVASLRAFLQHQHAQGVLREPLHHEIDMPRTYRLEQLPRALAWDQVIALLRSIDRSTTDGIRDFTLLYLAVRYGLRSGELVRLTLDDIDWRAGTLKVPQTKTRQTLRLPLTDEAGDILAHYLKVARPPSSYRQLFLRRRAPAGPLAHTAVHDILELRIARSGLDLPAIGSHVLRHSFAVHLLQQGVSMPTIGEALGHRDPQSTMVYLRLAVDDLREVALPLPKDGKAATLDARGWQQSLPPTHRRPRERIARQGFRSGLATSLRAYLKHWRTLGRSYRVEEDILRRWDDFLHRQFGTASVVHAQMFQRWASSMPHLHPTVCRNHLRVVRNFLLFHARQHPNTHIPDLATFPKPSPHQPPRLVSVAEMARMLATADRLPASHQNPLRRQTIHLALAILFCCGLRRGELLRLQIRHFDPDEEVLHIEATKFHKSRSVPLSKSVAQEVHRYLQLRRRRRVPAQPDSPLLWSENPVAHQTGYCAPALAHNWQQLCLAAKVLDARGRPPRLHDLRHSFAVAALHRWYQEGLDVQTKLPHLATYMGHVCPSSTHYYLHLTPGLREAASQRFHDHAIAIFGGAR